MGRIQRVKVDAHCSKGKAGMQKVRDNKRKTKGSEKTPRDEEEERERERERERGRFCLQ